MGAAALRCLACEMWKPPGRPPSLSVRAAMRCSTEALTGRGGTSRSAGAAVSSHAPEVASHAMGCVAAEAIGCAT